MKEEMSSLILRKWTRQLFLPLFIRSKLTPNQITTLNFFFTSLPSAYFLWTGYNLLCLLFICINIPIDFIDGELAKKTNQISKLGLWLDTSLDWLWQLLLLCIIILKDPSPVGMLALGMVVYCNYISATSKLQLDDFPFVMKYYLFFGILLKLYQPMLALIALSYTVKFFITGYFAIKERL